MFFVVQLIRVVKGSAPHASFKVDNLLVCLKETDDWALQYDTSGKNGWSEMGLKLIDFGRGIDMSPPWSNRKCKCCDPHR